MIRLLLAVFVLTTLAATPAQAYIDASLGALILQGLAAAFISAAIIWRSWIFKAKTLYRKIFKGDASEPGTGQ